MVWIQTVKWDAIKVCPMTLNRSAWHFSVLNCHLQYVAALLVARYPHFIGVSICKKSRLGLRATERRGQRENVSRVQRSRVSSKAFIAQFRKLCTNTSFHDLAQKERALTWHFLRCYRCVCLYVSKSSYEVGDRNPHLSV